MMALLLAACGLAGHFVTDALCGSYTVTEHECRERASANADALADCCCTHPSFLPSDFSVSPALFQLGFGGSLVQPRLSSVALRPPFHPPILQFASL
jgi:hypothetical protein